MPDAAVPVLDLRVGLARNVVEPGRNLWFGSGQAGVSQLHQGQVKGLLATFTPSGGASATRMGVEFARFRSALASSQAFDARGCSAGTSRIATWFELDAPDALAAEPAQVATWRARGVNVFALVGRRDNAVASSAAPSGPERAVGLTAAGRTLVQAIYASGGLIDVSYLSDSGFLEVLELSKTAGLPLLATRASARAVRQRPGSLADWQLRAVAETGGVVGIGFDRDLVGDGPSAMLSDVLQQIEHGVEIAGPDAVALGSGFDTGALLPASLSSAARFPRLAAALQALGMSDPAIRKLFYHNAWRALCGSTKASRSAAADP